VLLGYAAALAAVAVATGLGGLMQQAIRPPGLALVFVLPVVICAAGFGWGPALAAAVAGALGYNFFLIPPLHTLRIADPADLWTLVLLLMTGAIVSGVAAEARRRALQAKAAADQAVALQALARRLVAASDLPAIAQACAATLAQLFGAYAVVLLEADGGFDVRGAAGGAALTAADDEAARWSLASRLPTRGGAYPVGEAAFDFWPVITPQRQQAVIGVGFGARDDGRPAAPERLVEIVEGYLAVALDREAYARQVLESQVHSAAQRLQGDLLAAVSHDLKTPLSTILISLQSLQAFDGAHDAATRAELLAGAEAQTARLRHMVDNLLDMNRLEAGAIPVRPEPAVAAALVAAALARAGDALVDRKVVDETAEAQAPMLVDAALFESALANLLENAGKYSPAGSTVRIRAGGQDGEGWVEVLDEGPGFAGGAEALFGKFVRGRAGDGRPPGTGLGLSIARGFLEAQGGRVEADDRADRAGARVRLIAPLAA
jgi:two-component system sensor histidine kinase KdpD